jgi:hypothetical protein
MIIDVIDSSGCPFCARCAGRAEGTAVSIVAATASVRHSARGSGSACPMAFTAARRMSSAMRTNINVVGSSSIGCAHRRPFGGRADIERRGSMRTGAEYGLIDEVERPGRPGAR